MPTEESYRQQPAHRSASGIGIHAVEAAAICRHDRQREERRAQTVHAILPYEDTACCTD